ncbi:TonB-dependent receptor [Parvularcula flava]|nr:TonB-dependent receptor [Aquisalinus luteolus]NHK26432.1 TonB-dependent receptor [Aquisalinus luteolus]
MNTNKFMAVSAIALCAAGMAPSAFAQDAEVEGEDVITITGFRASLAEALDVKRESTAAVDAIVADDIADFPDQNLAEALGRVPGVAITRERGEGREITVRGLGGEYTRVRINGMESIASTNGNRGRGFDFNIFASELFNNIIIRKTATADVDEGSLGAVVDLNTGRPFAYPTGTTFAVNAQAQYNDLNEEIAPRLSGLFAYNNPEETFGITLSAALSDYETELETQNTVRWQRSRFASVGGQSCTTTPEPADCSTVTNAWHPRIPRYGVQTESRDRLGLTAGLQFKPAESTLITIDSLYSTYEASRSEIYGEVLFRGNEGGMDVVDYTYDPDLNLLTSMTVNNAWVRNEYFENLWTTDFHQFSANIEHDFTDSLRLNGMIGTSKSETDREYELTFMYDDRDYNGYFYDYSDDEEPVLAFNGPDVSDPANFQMTELRDRPEQIEHGYDTANFEVEWDYFDNHSVSVGGAWKRFTYEATNAARDTGVCAAGYFDCDTDNDGVDDLLGVPATDALSDIYTYGGPAGDGSTLTWAIPNGDAWTEYFDLFNLPFTSTYANNFNSVEEESYSVFFKLDGSFPVGTMELMYDVGGRYVETDQKSAGVNSGVQVEVDRDPYDDFLPAANLALWITDDLVLRGAAAKVMKRPGLGSLSPGGSVDSFNYRVSYSNPFLEPTRATTLDGSLEWYFADESLLSLAVFAKDIESFPINSTRTDTFASTGLPTSVLLPTSPTAQNPEGGPLESCNPANGGSGCWEIRSLDDGPGADIKGFEISMQTPLAEIVDVPPVLEGLGFIANYTYVDSDVEYYGGTLTERLIGLSNVSYNATVYYENGPFEARVSGSYRDDYLQGTRDNDFEVVGESFFVDFSSSYEINDQFEVSFEALNLTDEFSDVYIDREDQRRYSWEHTGRVFLVGARFKM